MSAFRLVMVSRRFWPLVGGAERVMAGLAAEFVRRGIDVTVLTARWQADWPAEIAYQGVRVLRLPQPSLRFWGTLRYMGALGRWLERRRGEYDLVYVSMLKHDAYAAVGSVAGCLPVVLRAEGSGREGDCVWQLDALGGPRIKRRCMRADALIGPSQAIVQELGAAGYARERTHYVPNGVLIPPARSAPHRAAARQALADSSLLWRCPAGAPLAVFVGRLHEAKGLAELVDAWESVAARHPDAQLWLVGEGPMEAALRARIEERDMGGRVVLAGVFDNVDEVLRAADLFVFPSWSEGMSLALLEAMGAGLPVVATDIPGNRGLIRDGQEALLVRAQDAGALAAAMIRLMEEPELAARLGTAARARVEAEFSLTRTADAHLALFDNLIGAKQSQDHR